MTSVCPACKGMAEMDEITQWPFCCSRCIGKHANKIVNAQTEAIRFWQKTCEPGAEIRGVRRDSPRQRWSESIERGLKKLNL
jgi:hypothetical protein